ncbi:glycoside hydrolase family 16 protein [Halobaculum marinum]|uniref:Glycoside hydrolase family 16 protein n=1 Tax=Halobaculum marinum TaxID=3031996 RepID=A0ABD5WX78_9EURY|nr:glycoside hydrolase family 16 protein [Halobaculum sp. DT55]
MNRRQTLGVLGAGAVGLLGIGRAQESERPSEGGPPDPEKWTLAFEDTFDGGTLDTDNWEIGWGWGRNTSISEARIVDENVTVRDGRLVLSGGHDGSEVSTGGVNTKNKVTFGPGSYLEAKIRFADREGFHNAFWSKPNSEAWPPEIDVVEQWHDEDSPAPTRQSHHHLHYPTSAEPGDDDTHENIGVRYEPGDDITENFHVYGAEWRSDHVTHYVDRERVRRWTDETMLESMANGAPFYMMVNLHINSIGSADMDEEWTEVMEVEWVRLWRTTLSQTDRRYFWARSSGEEPAKFAFRTDGGAIELDTEDPSVDYWVSQDGTTAGGTAPRASSLPGFWFEGEVVDFAYEGPIEVFIDNEHRDPDSLVDDTTAGPPLM